MCQLWREYNIEFLPWTQIFGFLLFLSDFLLSSTCVLPINRSAPISALCPALLLLAFFSLFPHPSSCHHCFLFSLLLCLSSPFKSHQKNSPFLFAQIQPPPTEEHRQRVSDMMEALQTTAECCSPSPVSSVLYPSHTHTRSHLRVSHSSHYSCMRL